MESTYLMVLVATIRLTLGSIMLPYVMESAETDEDNDEVKLNISSNLQKVLLPLRRVKRSH